MAEISDAALAELQQAHGLLKALYADSGSGMDFRKLVKKVFPKASIPELEAVERTEAMGGELTKKLEADTASAKKLIDDFLAKQAKKEEENQVEAFQVRLTKLQKERGYTEDGTKKILELMKERGIQNPEDAAVIFESTQPKASPKPKSFSSRMAFITPEDKDDENYKKLMADPEQYMVDEMMTAIGNAKQEE